MWARLKRLFRSVFGGLIEAAEDPELILQQTIRDMREKVPQMQNNVVQVMATEKLLQKEVVILEREIKDYDAKVKAAMTSPAHTSQRFRRSRRRSSGRGSSLRPLMRRPSRQRSFWTTTFFK